MENRIDKQELYLYHNQDLINELNTFMMTIKVHVFNMEDLYSRFPRPSINDIDLIHSKLNTILSEKKETLVKR